MIGRPRGLNGAMPIYVWDPAVKRKRYVGSATDLDAAQAIERRASKLVRPQRERTPPWRDVVGAVQRLECEAALARGEQIVYFIQADAGGPVKIGIALDPDDRLRNLQIGSPTRLVIRHVCPGGAELERELHQRFRDFCAWGEWFHPNPDLVELAGVEGSPTDAGFDSLLDRLRLERDAWRDRALELETRIFGLAKDIAA